MKKWIPLVLAALLLMTTAACGKVTELVQDTVTKQLAEAEAALGQEGASFFAESEETALPEAEEVGQAQTSALPTEGTIVYSPADEEDFVFWYNAQNWTYEIDSDGVELIDLDDEIEVTSVRLASMAFTEADDIPETNREAVELLLNSNSDEEFEQINKEPENILVNGLEGTQGESVMDINGINLNMSVSVWRTEERVYVCMMSAVDHTLEEAKAVRQNLYDTFMTAKDYLAAGGVAPEATPEPVVEVEPTEAPISGQPTEAPVAASVENSVLVDQDGVKVTVTGMTMDGWYGPSFQLTLENNTEQNLTFAARNSSVNGYMMDVMMSQTVAAGMKANYDLTISSSDLEAAGIKTIADIELSFNIYNSDSWLDYLNTDMIRIETSAAKEYPYPFDDSGEVLYNEKGIKMVYKGTTENWLYGTSLIIYYENNSDVSVNLSLKNAAVNGYMVDTYSSQTVLPNKRAIVTVGFNDLEKNGITKIETVQFTLQVTNSKTWDSFESGVIKLNVQ